MKYKNVVFGLILLLTLATTAHATLTNNITSYYTFDNTNTSGSTAVDVAGNNDGTIRVATTGVTGRINEAYEFNRETNEYVNLTTVTNSFTMDDGATMNFWVKLKPEDLTNMLLTRDGFSGSGDRTYTIFTDGNGELDIDFFNENGNVIGMNDNTDITDGSWHMVTITYDGSTLKGYLDASQFDSTSLSNIDEQGNNADIVGARPSDDTYTNGTIDEPAIWDRALSRSEITDLYNNGNGWQYSFDIQLSSIQKNTSRIEEKTKFAVNSTYTSSNPGIKANITVDFDLQNDGTIEKTSTTNNVANGTTITETFDCDAQNCDDGDKINVTYTAVITSDDTSTNKTFTVKSTGTIRVQTKEKITNDQVDTFTATANGTTQSTTNGTAVLNDIAVGNHTLTTDSTNYINTLTNNSVSVSFNQTTNVTLTGFYNHNLTINATEVIGTNKPTNFTAQITSQTNNYANNITTTTGQVTTGIVQNVTYNVSIPKAPGFATIFNNNQSLIMQTLTKPTTTQNTITFDAYTRNTLNATLIDVGNQSRVQTNATIKLTFGPRDYTFTTTDGRIIESQILTGQYDVTVGAISYTDTLSQLTMFNNSLAIEQYYLEQNTNPITFTVTNGLGDALTNATVTFQTKSNGTIVTVDELTTDLSGTVQPQLNPTRKYIVTAQAPRFTAFQGTVVPNDGPYTIKLNLQGQREFISAFNGTSHAEQFSQYNNYTMGNHTFTVFDHDSTLQRVNYTLRYESNTFTASSTDSTGATLQTTFNISPTTSSQVNVTYQITLTNGASKTFTKSYSVINPQGATLAGKNGVFSTVDVGVGGQAVLAYILIAAVTILTLSVTANITVGILAMMAATGAMATAGLLITQVTIVTIIAEALLLIGSTRVQI